MVRRDGERVQLFGGELIELRTLSDGTIALDMDACAYLAPREAVEFGMAIFDAGVHSLHLQADMELKGSKKGN